MSAILPTGLALGADAELPAFFLGRLASLVARHAAAVSPAEQAAPGLATCSIFLDRLDLGPGAEAHTLVEQLRTATGPVETVA